MSGGPGSGPAIIVRDALPADVPVIQSIYAHHVLRGLASFEEVPPDAAEIERRYREIAGRGLPYVVAEADGRVAGYAYAGPYRTRPAYRYTAENSVYIRHDCVGQGVGRALLHELIPLCEKAGLRLLVAVIGDSGNAASIELHRRAGFAEIGTIRAVGWKFDRWVDSVLMQRPLGAGDSTPP